jgi:hypothetical protein
MSDGDTRQQQAALQERAAILEIIERYSRQLSHGHGATGAQVLQQIVDEIHARGEPGPPRSTAEEG